MVLFAVSYGEHFVMVYIPDTGMWIWNALSRTQAWGHVDLVTNYLMTS